ncbi:collagen alpha-1(I) chain-like [Nomascus leucogenys]|uniref:collagen alpha-1(I) chain-like n=1 Tax=Nomascus leucogenys TaxID=61853 RepID=UPI00122D6DA2|nr:collagen alpha-1(I) chain-like [Nomascus leucogenys]
MSCDAAEKRKTEDALRSSLWAQPVHQVHKHSGEFTSTEACLSQVTHGDCLTSSNSVGRGNSQRTQPQRAPLLPCPEPPGSSPASTGLQRKRTEVPSGGSATARARGTRAADGPRRLKAAREDTAQADAQTGLPHPGHGGSELGSPGNPGFPSEASWYPVPSCSANLGQDMGPRRLQEPGAPQNPRGRNYLAAGDATRSGCPRAQRLP